MPKLFGSVSWDKAALERDSYIQIPIGPACRAEHCHPRDRFSLRMDRFTWATFQHVPSWVVKWFTTNLDVEVQGFDWLPFGLNNDGPGSSYISKYARLDKSELLYVNFQDNSLERINLKARYSGEAWVTYRSNVGIPVTDYLEEMSRHQLVLCPPGNGIDCYRTYEAIYLGCIPVLPSCILSRRMLDAGLPVLVVSDMFGLTEEFLRNAAEKVRSSKVCYDAVTVSAWRQYLASLKQAIDKC